MDITSVKPTTIDYNVQHPGTGEETGLILELVYPGHSRMDAAEKIHGKRVFKRNGDLDTAAQKTLSVHMYAAAVEGWRFEVGSDGTRASFNGGQPDFDRQMFANYLGSYDGGWLREQLRELYEDRKADFFQGFGAKSETSETS